MLCFARGCGGGKASFALFFHLVLEKLVLVSLIIKKKKSFRLVVYILEFVIFDILILI